MGFIAGWLGELFNNKYQEGKWKKSIIFMEMMQADIEDMLTLYGKWKFLLYKVIYCFINQKYEAKYLIDYSDE